MKGRQVNILWFKGKAKRSNKNMTSAHPHTVSLFTVGEEPRGYLSFVEPEKTAMATSIKRVYWITGMGNPWTRWVNRGSHAHRTCRQLFYCLKGRAVFTVSRPGRTIRFALDPRSYGLYLPPMWWHTMRIKRGSVILALASDHHNEAEYIRSREEFERLYKNEA